MIKTLKRNFMLSVILLFTFTFIILALSYFSYSNSVFYEDTYNELEWLSTQKDLSTTNKEELENSFKFEMEYYGYNAIYIYRIDKKGQIIEHFFIGKTNKKSISKEKVITMLNTSKNQHRINTTVFYRSTLADGTTMLLATDCYSDYNSWYIKLILKVFLISLISIILISIFLSKFITIPTEHFIRTEKRLQSDTSHELKTPITGFIVSLSVLRRKYPDDISIQHTLDEAKNLSQIVEELTTMSAIEENKNPIFNEHFSASEYVLRIINTLNETITSKGLCITTHIDSGIKYYANKEQFGKMVISILENAIKYNKEDGSIDVQLHRNNKNIVLTISDTGIGIAPEDLPYIFERFYQADKSHSGSSTGLGLAIAKAIVNGNDGKIYAESELNEGTKIIVVLPFKKRKKKLRD